MGVQGWEMDGLDTHKYPHVENNQPGLEVSDDPYRTPHSGWPDPTHPVWGASNDILKPGATPKHTPSGASTEKFLAESGDRGKDTSATRKILGLSVGVFWAVVALLFCILAAGIGGGIGAGLASRKRSCSTDSGGTPTSTANATTSTTTPDAPASPAPTSLCSTRAGWNGTILTPHDAAGNEITLSNTAQKFQVFCETNFLAGPSYELHNIMKIWTVDLTTCLDQCAEYNAGLETLIFNGIQSSDGGGSGFCRAVSLGLSEGGFCYLKNSTGSGIDTSSAAKQIASAVLITNTP